MRPRRAAIAGGLAAALLLAAGCQRGVMTPGPAHEIDQGELNRKIGEIAARARPATLGVGLFELTTGEAWSYNGERRFPLAGAANLVVAAAVLAEADDHRLSLAEPVGLEAQDLSPPPSPVASAWPAQSHYTLDALLSGLSRGEDTTAHDVLLKRIGGPGAALGWLQGKRIQGVRVDRYNRQRLPEMAGLATFHPDWRRPEAYAAATDAVPLPRRRAAEAAYLADPRDTATPQGMTALLTALAGGELLSPAASRRLLGRMESSDAAAGPLRAGLPRGARLAAAGGADPPDRGASPARAEVGIVTRPDGRRYAIAVFLAGDRRGAAAARQVIADVATAVAESVG